MVPGMRHSLWPAFLLVAVSLLVFGAALPNPLYFDDLLFIRNNAWLYGGVPIYHWFKSAFVDSSQMFTAYRPLVMASYAADIRLFGDAPEALRIVNVLLHLVNAWLLARLLLLLIRDESMKWVAWGAAFLFLLHPLQTLPINLLWKRSTLLEELFLLTGLLLHVVERLRDGPYRRRVVLGECLVFLGALFSKESGIVLPLLLLLADLAFFREWRRLGARRSWILYLTLALLGILFVWFRLGIMEPWIAGHTLSGIPSPRDTGRIPYWIASLNIIPRYVLLWLIPRPLILDDPTPLAAFPWGGAAATACLAGLTVWLAFRFRRRPLVPFSLGLFWIGLGPTIGPVPLTLVMDQVRLYLPLAGLACLSALVLGGAARRLKVAPWILITVVCASYGTASLLQNVRYRYPALIWQDVVEAYPESSWGWEHLGTALHEAGRFEDAARAYEMATRMEPGTAIFGIYATLNRLETATPEERGRQLDSIPTGGLDGGQLLNIALWEVRHREEARAEAHLLQAIQRSPTLYLAHLNLGVLWEKTGRLNEARRAYANALAIAPHEGRALAAIKRLGRPERVAPQ
jgi:tetratricopeptide (TPR) repeat protein